MSSLAHIFIVYVCVSTTRIKIRNIVIIPGSSFLPLLANPQIFSYITRISFICSRMLQSWKHTAWSFLCLLVVWATLSVWPACNWSAHLCLHASFPKRQWSPSPGLASSWIILDLDLSELEITEMNTG